MAVNKRKKNSRQRGSHTHGWGSMKKHRGAGNRGGAGNAGSGKRADSKKPSFWKGRRSGKHGFVNRGRTGKTKAINVSSLEKKMDEYISKKIAKEEQGAVSINLKDAGYGKLLSRGKATRKMLISCDAASSKAVEAVKAAGGKVTLPKEAENGAEGLSAESS